MKTPTLLKTIRGTCVMLLAGIQVGFAQCPTTLTVTGTSNSNGDVAGAITLNSPPTSSGIYFWSLSDGTNTIYYNSTSSTHTFPGVASGTYSLCASYNDSINACTAYGNCSVLSVVNTNTTCTAGFTYSIDSTCTVHFYNTSSGSSLTYQWYDMSSGFAALSTQANPSLVLAQGGHNIALYTYTNGQFCDSATQYINVTCVNSYSPCNASFTYYTDSNCVTHFVNTTTGSNLTYYWYDFSGSSGSGQFSTQPNPTYVFTNGIHDIGLYVNSGGQFCDSANAQLNITCGSNPVLPCQAGFQIFADSVNPGNYFAYNTSTGSGLSYLWDFGDGTTSTQQYPFHQYATVGHYVVCLTVTGTNTCTSTYCDSSSVHKTASMSSIHVVPQGGVTGVQSQAIVKSLKAYPNPMADELTVEIETASHDQLMYTLTDGLGRTVAKSDISSSSLRISTSGLDKGFYFLSVSDKNGKSLKTIKLLK